MKHRHAPLANGVTGGMEAKLVRTLLDDKLQIQRVKAVETIEFSPFAITSKATMTNLLTLIAQIAEGLAENGSNPLQTK